MVAGTTPIMTPDGHGQTGHAAGHLLAGRIGPMSAPARVARCSTDVMDVMDVIDLI